MTIQQNNVFSLITEQSLLGDIVTENYQAAKILEHYHLDFCCHGDRTLQLACDERQLSAKAIIEEIRSLSVEAVQPGGVPPGLKDWPLDLMADYVEKKHHRYVNAQTPVIMTCLQKILQVHGSRHPELAEVQQIFQTTAGELAMHMKKEELMLFPYIRKMVTAQLTGRQTDPPPFGSIRHPIHAMEADHEAEGNRLAKMRELTGNFQSPADACNTYRLTLTLLEAFEEDLHQHIHIENNILFPGAIRLETSLLLPEQQEI